MIIPSDLQRAAVHAMRETLDAIRRDGSSAAVAARMISFEEREAVVGTAEYLALGERYSS